MEGAHAEEEALSDEVEVLRMVGARRHHRARRRRRRLPRRQFGRECERLSEPAASASASASSSSSTPKALAAVFCAFVFASPDAAATRSSRHDGSAAAFLLPAALSASRATTRVEAREVGVGLRRLFVAAGERLAQREDDSAEVGEGSVGGALAEDLLGALERRVVRLLELRRRREVGGEGGGGPAERRLLVALLALVLEERRGEEAALPRAELGNLALRLPDRGVVLVVHRRLGRDARRLAGVAEGPGAAGEKRRKAPFASASRPTLAVAHECGLLVHPPREGGARAEAVRLLGGLAAARLRLQAEEALGLAVRRATPWMSTTTRRRARRRRGGTCAACSVVGSVSTLGALTWSASASVMLALTAERKAEAAAPPMRRRRTSSDSSAASSAKRRGRRRWLRR